LQKHISRYFVLAPRKGHVVDAKLKKQNTVMAIG